MKMDDAELKRLIQEGMDYEAERIMAEVESDPNLKDVVAPEEIFENLMKQIHDHEMEEEREREALSQEEQELIRLGKIYKKKRSRRKYIVLIAAVVCALGVGTISFGDKGKVFTEIQRMLGDRKQTVVNSGDEDTSFVDDVSTEEGAYQQIEKMFGFVPVKMYYLPNGMDFQEMNIEKNLQFAQLQYKESEGISMTYRIVTDYRTSSTSSDIEDEFVREYDKKVGERNITIKEYLIKDNNLSRWLVNFDYENAQYTIVITGVNQSEVEKIIENLYFS